MQITLLTMVTLRRPCDMHLICEIATPVPNLELANLVSLQ